MREEQATGEAGARAQLLSAGILATAPDGHGSRSAYRSGLTAPNRRTTGWLSCR